MSPFDPVTSQHLPLGYFLALIVGGIIAEQFNPRNVFGLAVALSVIPAVLIPWVSCHSGALYSIRMFQVPYSDYNKAQMALYYNCVLIFIFISLYKDSISSHEQGMAQSPLLPAMFVLSDNWFPKPVKNLLFSASLIGMFHFTVNITQLVLARIHFRGLITPTTTNIKVVRVVL